MTCRILIVGDGAHELGDMSDEHEYAPTDSLPALPRLVHRLLNEPNNTAYSCRIFKNIKAAHGKGEKWYKKTKRVIENARHKGFDGVVILLDRDDSTRKMRLVPLQEARDEMAADCAVGNAIMMFDAWMIADENAIRHAGGNPEHAHQNPESLTQPKQNAFRGFDKKNLIDFYKIISDKIDLKLLKTRCKKGFEPFAKEIEQRIAPLILKK